MKNIVSFVHPHPTDTVAIVRTGIISMGMGETSAYSAAQNRWDTAPKVHTENTKDKNCHHPQSPILKIQE